MPATTTKRLRHGRVEVALHVLKPGGDGPGLLLLHALFGSSADWPDAAASWPGPVHALDFSGHGESDWLPGRGYSPEVYVAEADMAVAHLTSDERPLVLAGAGIGAYVALLLSGARSDVVHRTLLWPGAGLDGGGATPGEFPPERAAEWRAEVETPAPQDGDASPDPLVSRCDRDVRPVDYAEAFAKAARQLHIATVAKPPKWLSTAIEVGPSRGTPDGFAEALEQIASE